MKILFVTERFPWPLEDGGNLRTYHVLKALCQQHDVTLLSHAQRDQEELAERELQTFCRIKTVAKPGKLSVVAGILLRPWRWTQSLFVLRNWSEWLFLESQKLVTECSFDVVHFNHLDTAAFLTRANYPSSVFDSHNCISKMAEQSGDKRSSSWMRLIYSRESKALAKAERAVCQRADVVLACSEQDQTSFLKLAPSSNVHVVPNGVDTKRFDHPESSNWFVKSPVPRIVFTGAMDYAPNVEGVEWFCKNVLPIIQKHEPNVLMQVVGRDPSQRITQLHDLRCPVDGTNDFPPDDRVGVEVTGRVESVSPYLASAAIVVVPLLDGGGTRLKILEAFAAKRAVISTTKGAEGIDAQPGNEILIADDPQSFGMAVVRLLRDPTEAKRIGNAGYRLACQRYDWQTIAGQILDTYEHLASAKPNVITPKPNVSKSKITTKQMYNKDKVTQ